MEAGELDGNVRTKIVVEPITKLPCFVRVLAYLGNYQVGQFGVNALVLQLQERLLYRLCADGRCLPLLEGLLSTSLVIHDNSINVALDRSNSLHGSIPVRNKCRIPSPS